MDNVINHQGTHHTEGIEGCTERYSPIRDNPPTPERVDVRRLTTMTMVHQSRQTHVVDVQ